MIIILTQTKPVTFEYFAIADHLHQKKCLAVIDWHLHEKIIRQIPRMLQNYRLFFFSCPTKNKCTKL